MPERSRSVTVRVAREVATYKGTDPLELPPLAETCDPETVERCLDLVPDMAVTFEYAGLSVTVDGDRAVDLSPIEETELRERTTRD